MLQVWAQEARIRFRYRSLPFVGRFRHGVTEALADKFGIDDDDAEEQFCLMESINGGAHMSLTKFLWTDGNHLHCVVL